MRARVSVCWHNTADTHHFTKNTFRTLIIAQVTANDFGSFTRMGRQSNQIQARPDDFWSYLLFSHPHAYSVACPGGLHAITIDAKMSQVAAAIPKSWCRWRWRWRRISSIIILTHELHGIGYELDHFQVLKRVALIHDSDEAGTLCKLAAIQNEFQLMQNVSLCITHIHILTDSKWIIYNTIRQIHNVSPSKWIGWSRVIHFASPIKRLNGWIYIKQHNLFSQILYRQVK